jgi:hypothetical protein
MALCAMRLNKRKELLIDDLFVLFDQLRAHILRCDLHQPFHELDALLLSLDHFGRDAVLAQNGLDHGFIRQVGLRAEQISLAFFGRQAVGHLLDERTDHLFLLVQRQRQFGREEGQQEFLVIVVIHDGSASRPFVSAELTAGVVGLPAQQALFGLRVGGHVEQLLDVGRDHLFTAWTCNGVCGI